MLIISLLEIDADHWLSSIIAIATADTIVTTTNRTLEESSSNEKTMI